MPQAPHVLLLSADREETEIIKNLLRGLAVPTCVETIAQVNRCLATKQHDLMFCNWFFRDGQWKDALGIVSRAQPTMPVVVFSRTATEREWVTVIETGAFDLLVPPYGELQLLAVMEQAISSAQAKVRQREVLMHQMLRAS